MAPKSWRPAAMICLLILLSILAFGCGGGGDEDAEIRNSSPIARAGSDQTVAEGADVTLDGSASSDSDGRIVAYRWTQTAGPSVALTNATAARAGFRAPDVAVDTILEFQLRVQDDEGAASTDAVRLIVAHIPAENESPIARAGSNQTVAEGADVTLDGAASSDSDGRIVAYQWTQTAGPSVALTNATAARTAFRAPDVAVDTILEFQLRVQDDEGAASTDAVRVAVEAQTDATVFHGSGRVETGGGEIEAGDVNISVPTNAILRPIQVNVAETDLPSALPAGLAQVDDAFDIQISDADQDFINGPFEISITYDDAGTMDDGDVLLPLHFEGGEYRPVRILAIDSTTGRITFESRSFSTFVLTAFDPLQLPGSHQTGFFPNRNGWQIGNHGSYFTPNGDCLGMSGYAVWYFNNRSDELFGKFADHIAYLTAVRAHLAQSQTWADSQWRELADLPETYVVSAMKGYMRFLGTPLILLMGNDGVGDHASVVYGYDSRGFEFYDVNFPEERQSLAYNGGFGTYAGRPVPYRPYDSFGFVGNASLGRTEDFGNLTAQATAGFTSSSYIEVTSPRQGEVIDTRETTLSGSVDTSLGGGGTVGLVLSVNGQETREVGIGGGGNFHEALEVSEGTNTLIFLAGVNIKEQSNWHRNAATLIRTFEGDVPFTNLLVTLSWDQNLTDVDLYITEPQGETMWYRNLMTANGLTLDIDDTDGFGPEHGTLGESDTALEGTYRVRVHYYSDGGTGLAATGKVTIVVHEGLRSQRVETVRFSIASDDSSASGPGSSGSSWSDIANVDVVGGAIEVRP